MPPVVEPVVLVVEPVLPEVLVVPVVLLVLLVPVEPVLPEVLVLPVVLLVLLVPVEPVLPEVLVEPVLPVELVVEELDDVVPLSSLFLSFLQLVASNKDSENTPAIKTTFGVCDVFIGSFFISLHHTFKPHSIFFLPELAS